MMSRDYIGPSDMLANRIMGRDHFEVPESKVVADGGIEIKYPLEWMKPRRVGAAIGFGPGIGYATGLKPSNANDSFVANTRICLIETMTPVVTFTSWTDGVSYEGIYVSSIDSTCEIGAIASPYKSQGSKLKYPGPCQPEIRITVLGYLNSDGRMAIAEKVLYDDGMGGTHFSLCRYPYYLSNLITGSVATASASAYYYNEQEILDDPDI